jgi:hypothetical protein
MNAVMKMTKWLTGISAALVAVAMAVPTADAQQQKAPTPPPSPAAKAPVTKAPAAKPAKAAKAKRPASQCKGLAEPQCKGTAGCTWRAERTVKKGERKGKKISAHCRLDTPPPKRKAKADGTSAPIAKKAPAKAATPPPSSAGSAPKK